MADPIPVQDPQNMNTQQGQWTQPNPAAIQPNQQDLQQNMQWPATVPTDQQAEPYSLSDDDLQLNFDEPQQTQQDDANDPLSFADDDWTLDDTFDPDDNVTTASPAPDTWVAAPAMGRPDVAPASQPSDSLPQDLTSSSDTAPVPPVSDVASVDPVVSTMPIQPEQPPAPDMMQMPEMPEEAVAAPVSVAPQSEEPVAAPVEDVSVSKGVPATPEVAPIASVESTMPAQSEQPASAPGVTMAPEISDMTLDVPTSEPAVEPLPSFDDNVSVWVEDASWEIPAPVAEEPVVQEPVVEESVVAPVVDDMVPREQQEQEPEEQDMSMGGLVTRVMTLTEKIQSYTQVQETKVTAHKTEKEHVEYSFALQNGLTVTKISHHEDATHVLSFVVSPLRVLLDNDEVYHEEKDSVHDQVESYIKDKLMKFVMLLEHELDEISSQAEQEQKKKQMVRGLRNF